MSDGTKTRDELRAEVIKELEKLTPAELLEKLYGVKRGLHATGDCHICGKPRAGPGSDYCSYPHGMVPEKAVNVDRPQGFWTWKLPDEGNQP